MVNKKSIYKTLFLRIALCLAVILSLSCQSVKRAGGFQPPEYTVFLEAETYADVFSAIWKVVDQAYVFWDVEKEGYWDWVWDTYKPKFDALPETIDSLEAAYSYLEEILSPLYDGHFVIQLAGDRANWLFGPGKKRVDARFNGPEDDKNPFRVFSFESDWDEPKSGPEPYHWNFIDHFIGPKYLDNYVWASYPSLCIAKGKIPIAESPNEYIAYLYFDNFTLEKNIYKEEAYIPKIPEDRREVTNILNAFQQDSRSRSCKGIIFDLRGNQGGDVDDIPMLLGPFVDNEVLIFQQYYKEGTGRLDFSRPWKVIMGTEPEEKRIANMGIPIVGIINDYSISCGELMPMNIRELPNSYLVGTRTFGATGNLTDSSFIVTWGEFQEWSIRQSTIQTKDKNSKSYEITGVEPDLTVPFSWKQFTNNGAYDSGGTDAQLEAAIRHIDPAHSFRKKR